MSEWNNIIEAKRLLPRLWRDSDAAALFSFASDPDIGPVAGRALHKSEDRCFDNPGLDAVWCAYYDGNAKSRRVIEKCGFRFHHTNLDVVSPLGDIRTEHFYLMTKDDYAATLPEILELV